MHYQLSRSILLMFALIVPASLFAKVQVGKPLPQLTIAGDEGGIVDGRPWDSHSVRGNTTIILYIDPDQRNDNEALQQALKKANFRKRGFRSVAIINMAATWLPNFAIAEKMAKKQKEFPNTPQVKDLNRKGIATWGVKDDAYNVILVDNKSNVIFLKSGKLSQDEITQVIALIDNNLTNSPGPKITAPPKKDVKAKK